MARPKYTILKVLLQISNKGFTMLELIIGLSILLLISGLTLNALNQASDALSKDKKNIDSSQSISAVLELIGNDVKQAGEFIRQDSSFPAIVLSQNATPTLPIKRSGTVVAASASSTLIVRRALTANPLTLCANVPTGTATTVTRIVVGDTTVSPGACNPLAAATAAPPANAFLNPLVSTSPILQAKNYRCELGDPNLTYDPAQDSCVAAAASMNNNTSLQRVLVAISDNAGNICVFNYTGEDTSNPAQYKLIVTAISSNCNNTVAYNYNATTPTPVYLIEERRYNLDANNNLTLATDGGVSTTPPTLMSGIAKFKVSARAYKVDATVTPAITLNDRVIQPTGLLAGAGSACTTAGVDDGVSMPVGTATATDPTYACRLNVGANPAKWNEIAGVRIEMESRYGSTGINISNNPLTNYLYALNNRPEDIEKLQAAAEYFPRNVLSK